MIPYKFRHSFKHRSGILSECRRSSASAAHANITCRMSISISPATLSKPHSVDNRYRTAPIRELIKDLSLILVSKNTYFFVITLCAGMQGSGNTLEGCFLMYQQAFRMTAIEQVPVSRVP